MKRPSFGIIGLTRDELSQQQLFLDVTRKHPERAEHFLAWLKGVANGDLPPSKRLPRAKDIFELQGDTLVRRSSPKMAAKRIS